MEEQEVRDGASRELWARKIDADFDQTEGETSAAQTAYGAAIAANAALISGNAMNDSLANPYLGEYEIGGDAMGAIPSLTMDLLQFQLYADGELKFNKHVTSSRAFRLPEWSADNVVRYRECESDRCCAGQGTMDGFRRSIGLYGKPALTSHSDGGFYGRWVKESGLKPAHLLQRRSLVARCYRKILRSR